MEKENSHYKFVSIPTDDVRDKPKIKQKKETSGLIDSGGKKIKSKHEIFLKKMFLEIIEFHK